MSEIYDENLVKLVELLYTISVKTSEAVALVQKIISEKEYELLMSREEDPDEYLRKWVGNDTPKKCNKE